MFDVKAGPPLRLFLLGDFQVTYEDRAVADLHARRTQALLAYLALHPDEAIPRRRLAFLFWPDTSERQARTNLRQLLHRLRRLFPPIEDFLTFDTALRWQVEAPVYVDACEFTALLAQAEQAAADNDLRREATALEDAIALYRGDLLLDCYDDWIIPERETLRRRFSTALKRLLRVLEGRGDYARALTYGERLLALDEFDESGHRLLMRLHALNRDRAGALRIYKRCVAVLDQELGVEPEPATRALRDRLLTMSDVRPDGLVREQDIPLVGREGALRQAQQVWQEVGRGSLRVLSIQGEAGVGKTRLAEELMAYVGRLGYNVVVAGCYEAAGRLAYGPIGEWLQSPAIYGPLQALPEVWQVEIARVLPRLHADHPHLPQPAPLTEGWQRQRLFSAIAQAVLAASQPLLLFLDNIQWSDPETLAWLTYLLRSHPSAPILILATVRSGAANNAAMTAFHLELRRQGMMTEIKLGPLNAAETALLAAHVAGRGLDGETAAALHRRTEGNPLFIVEMVRASLNEGNGESLRRMLWEHEGLPQRVQAVIQGRLAHLSPASRKLLALAAVVGRVFTFETLAHACEEDEETVLQSLDELWEHRLIRAQGPMAYDFSHGIIRDVVEGEIGHARRGVLHRRVAQALEQMHADHLDAYSARLAHHWLQAGFPRRAIAYHLRAGRTAQRLFANDEAERHLQQGLRLCEAHLEGEERDRTMLKLLLTLSPSLVQGRGYGAGQVQAAGARVQALSKRVREPISPPLLRMLAISKLVTGRIAEARELGEQLLAQARADGDPVAEVEAHYVLGVTHHWRGDFPRAETHLEQAIALYRPQHHETHIRAYAQDPSVVCRIRLALVRWHLAHPLCAQKTGREALAIARELDHLFSRAYALHWFAWLQNLRGDAEATLRAAGASISFSEEYQFPYFATQSKVLLGWALHQKGYTADGLQAMREGLSYFRATDSEVGCAYYRALIAEALAADGGDRQSKMLLAEAQQGGWESGERWSEAAIATIHGRVLAAQDKAAAEGAFRQAVAVAREQGNRMDALRAAEGLRGILRAQGRGEEGERTFDEVYGWAVGGLPAAEAQAVTVLFHRPA
ncbi:MAG: hypothetical protein D6775_05425 [Caldilineae bacterium]|nr:MAG: hypothetical protein D6775_05425 [Caldilineae bacterium]